MQDMDFHRWTHPGVILVATDLSDMERLEELSLRQAAETGARLLLFHVVSHDAAFAAEAMGFPPYDLSGAAQRARAALQPWCMRARAGQIRCDILIREGHAALQIMGAVRQFQVDRILLGTRGRGRFSKLLLGSVAEQVLRSAHLPVITVGPEAHPGVESDTRARVVLLATTLRETSRTSAALACQIAAGQQARLVILHVLPAYSASGTHSVDTIDAERRLHFLAAEQCAPAGIAPEMADVLVSHGSPCEQILATACDRQAGLIVLGAAHHPALYNLTHDRTVYKVLAHARCPVLTLRESCISPHPVEAEQELMPI